jgi:hypothetical protein
VLSPSHKHNYLNNEYVFVVISEVRFDMQFSQSLVNDYITMITASFYLHPSVIVIVDFPNDADASKLTTVGRPNTIHNRTNTDALQYLTVYNRPDTVTEASKITTVGRPYTIHYFNVHNRPSTVTIHNTYLFSCHYP